MSRFTIVLAIFLIGCTDSAPEADAVDAPLLPPEAHSTSQQMIDVFTSTCLPDFPELEKVERAIQNTGFRSARSDERPYDGIYAHQTLGIDASVGNIGIYIAFDGPPGVHGAATELISPECSIMGFVSDPESFGKNVVAAINSALPEAISSSDDSDETWSWKFLVNDEEISLSAFVQEPQSSNFSRRCNGTFPCQWWSYTGLHIVAPTRPARANP